MASSSCVLMQALKESRLSSITRSGSDGEETPHANVGRLLAARRKSKNPFVDEAAFAADVAMTASDTVPLLLTSSAGHTDRNEVHQRAASDEESQLDAVQGARHSSSTQSPCVDRFSSDETAAEPLRSVTTEGAEEAHNHKAEEQEQKLHLLGHQAVSNEAAREIASSRQGTGAAEAGRSGAAASGNPFAAFLGNPFGLRRLSLSQRFGSYRAPGSWVAPSEDTVQVHLHKCLA